MEDMRAELDSMSQLGPYWGRFLPPGGVTDRMLPAIRQEFRVDIREHDGEVIVVADLSGGEKDDVSLQFLNPRMLEISCERKGEKEEKSEGYYCAGEDLWINATAGYPARRSYGKGCKNQVQKQGL
jgi:HSP20 family protein